MRDMIFKYDQEPVPNLRILIDFEAILEKKGFMN